VFLHGASLYQTERHVPLVIVPPGGSPSPRVVTQTVSLRDLAATIVDVLGFKVDSPFPGNSLARFWNPSAAPAPAHATAFNQALSELFPDPDALHSESMQSLTPHWPMAALTEGDWAYIRQEGDVREELFHLGADANELHNLAGDPANEPTLERMRKALDRLRGGGLTSQPSQR